MYENYVSQAMGDYWRRQNAHRPSGLEMVLGGLANGIGTGYAAYLEDKRQKEREAFQARNDEANRQYMQAQMDAMTANQARQDQASKQQQYKEVRASFLSAAPKDAQGNVDMSGLPAHVRGLGYDPENPMWKSIAYTPAEGLSSLMESQKARDAADKAGMQFVKDIPLPGGKIGSGWVKLGEAPDPKALTVADRYKEGGGAGEAGSWSTLTDDSGNLWEHNSKTGEMRAAKFPGAPPNFNKAKEPNADPRINDIINIWKSKNLNPLTGMPKPNAQPLDEALVAAGIDPTTGRPAKGTPQPAAPAMGPMTAHQPGTTPKAAPSQVKFVRYGTTADGRRVAMGDDGKIYEVPS